MTPPGGSPTWGVTRTWRGGIPSVGVTPSGGVTPGGPSATPHRGYTTRSLRPIPTHPGDQTLLRWIPVGTRVAGPDGVGTAPGVSLHLLRHRDGFSECRYPSGEHHWLPSDTVVGVGPVGDPLRKHLKLLTAGDTHHRGGRPRVRGVAMNPVDHPHGGGQGKTSGGRPGTTPWGRLTKGWKTRR